MDFQDILSFSVHFGNIFQVVTVMFVGKFHQYMRKFEIMNGNSVRMLSTNTMDSVVSHNISEFSIVFLYSTHDCSTEQSRIFFAPPKKNPKRRGKVGKQFQISFRKVNFTGRTIVLDCVSL